MDFPIKDALVSFRHKTKGFLVLSQQTITDQTQPFYPRWSGCFVLPVVSGLYERTSGCQCPYQVNSEKETDADTRFNQIRSRAR